MDLRFKAERYSYALRYAKIARLQAKLLWGELLLLTALLFYLPIELEIIGSDLWRVENVSLDCSKYFHS